MPVEWALKWNQRSREAKLRRMHPDEMNEARLDPTLPEVYVRVALAVEEDGTAVLIISPPAIEGRAERESVEPTLHSPAQPSAFTTPPDRADDEHAPPCSTGATNPHRNTAVPVSAGAEEGPRTADRFVAENLEDLVSTGCGWETQTRRRDQVEGEGYPWAVRVGLHGRRSDPPHRSARAHRAGCTHLHWRI
eukprot:6178711-Pleurochrysis_carterae.AAC.1